MSPAELKVVEAAKAWKELRRGVSDGGPRLSTPERALMKALDELEAERRRNKIHDDGNYARGSIKQGR